MEKFAKDLITYLDEKFQSDTCFSKSVTGDFAYANDLINFNGSSLKYVIEILDDRTETETFNSEATFSNPLQITVAGIKTKVNDVLTDSHEVAFILANKIKDFLEEYKYSGENSNIIKMRRMVVSPPLKFNDAGTVYIASLRYDFILKSPYVSEAE